MTPSSQAGETASSEHSTEHHSKSSGRLPTLTEARSLRSMSMPTTSCQEDKMEPWEYGLAPTANFWFSSMIKRKTLSVCSQTWTSPIWFIPAPWIEPSQHTTWNRKRDSWVTAYKMEPCTACLRGKIMSLSWSLAVKERQYISGIVMKPDQWLRLTTRTKFWLFKWAQAED